MKKFLFTAIVAIIGAGIFYYFNTNSRYADRADYDVYLNAGHLEKAKHTLAGSIRFWENKVNRIGISRYRSGNNESGEVAQVATSGQRKRFPCPQLWQRMVVLFDGTVLMCCGDHHSKNPIGNIRTRTIQELWHSQELTAMRQLHSAHRYDEIDACRDCQINCI